mgnify:CR=1 FL=1
MKTNHTQGPWQHVDLDYIKSKSGVIVTSLKCDISLSMNEVNANAKLIAAAPELLIENEENHKFLSWLAQEVSSGRIDFWSDKRQLVYERLASTGRATKKATE